MYLETLYHWAVVIVVAVGCMSLAYCTGQGAAMAEVQAWRLTGEHSISLVEKCMSLQAQRGWDSIYR